MLPYPGWSVNAGDTPPETKWNQLGINLDALADGTGLDSGAVTTDKQKAHTWSGLMSAGTVTTTTTTFASVSIPATTVPHSYLIIASFEFANNGGGGGDYGAWISDGATGIASNYWYALAGSYLNTITVEHILTTSAAKTINFRADKSGSAQNINNRSRYVVVDLGVA